MRIKWLLLFSPFIITSSIAQKTTMLKVRIEGENHTVRNFSRKMEWQRTTLAFFAKHLKSDDRWWVEMLKPTAV